MSLSALKCRRCGSAMQKDVAGGLVGRFQPVLICPKYRWYHLFLHDAIGLGR